MKNFIKALALTFVLSVPAYAEMVSADWLDEGDSRATTDLVSGNTWISLQETKGKSVSQVQSLLDSTYIGWRLPTRFEMEELFQNNYSNLNLLTGQTYSVSTLPENIAFNAMIGMGTSNGGFESFGLFLNDEMSTTGGSVVMGMGAYGGSILYYNYSGYNMSTYHGRYGVYLIKENDIIDGSGNISDVSGPFGGFACLLAFLAFGQRRKA